MHRLQRSSCPPRKCNAGGGICCELLISLCSAPHYPIKSNPVQVWSPCCPGFAGTHCAQPSTLQCRQTISLSQSPFLKAGVRATYQHPTFHSGSINAARHVSSGMVAFSTVPRSPHSCVCVRETAAGKCQSHIPELGASCFLTQRK